ncbi:MAG: signal peptidase I [Spirochaetes bacterium]|nr:MAG: signal peptidase I [Spirochaetota bacterium]
MRRKYSTYHERNRSSKKFLRIIKYLLFLFLLYTFITVFLLSSYVMKTSSMEPDLKTGQRVLAAPVVYGGRFFNTKFKLPGFRNPERGDIAVLSINTASLSKLILDSALRFFTFQQKTIFNSAQDTWKRPVTIKRIIGVPGDVVRIDNYTAYIKTAGSSSFSSERDIILKRYTIQRGKLPDGWSADLPFSGSKEPVKLKEGEYLVLNDNRADVNDSRLFGPVPESAIKALVFLSYLPGFSFK